MLCEAGHITTPLIQSVGNLGSEQMEDTALKDCGKIQFYYVSGLMRISVANHQPCLGEQTFIYVLGRRYKKLAGNMKKADNS